MPRCDSRWSPAAIAVKATQTSWHDSAESGWLTHLQNGRLRRAPQMEGYPKFHNEGGVPIVRIGCREFKCIGDKPPQDHPHIYLNMGDASEIVCPYCSTLFCFDPSLGVDEADPADCAYSDID